jgi:hypothetical protein
VVIQDVVLKSIQPPADLIKAEIDRAQMVKTIREVIRPHLGEMAEVVAFRLVEAMKSNSAPILFSPSELAELAASSRRSLAAIQDSSEFIRN